jgi:hypothetical protein
MSTSSTWYFPFRFSDQNFVRVSHLSHASSMHELFLLWK